ncbi:serine/threonine protein kinase, CMGC, dual-specificity [Zalaria obscura]|uniref:Serine/threonine protein kinase, CMGC, dual-specificity n=1 Tax=Zalaria obscura TaxID=2024903 RepID=A0ACC3SKU8_9PEZI
MESRLPTRSPSLIPRKTSMTPSSARNTPESSVRYQQPHASATLSTSSSFQSLRGGSALGLPKPSQPPSVSTSKLPTPKSRNVYSSAERRDEVVPPVPAIPKAYESPKDQIEIPFFSNTKFEDSTPSTPPVGSVESDGAISTSVVPSSTEKNRHRRVLTVGAPANTERAPALPAVNKKSLQPLRLPPLNLLPLSTPTAAKINSYPQPSAEVERREAATPPRRNVTKTPSTPMTASKATFLRRNDQAQGSQVTLRSASSHHALRAAMDRTPYDDSDNGVPLPMSVADKRQTITPFASGSLPKHSGEYARYKARQADEYTLGHGNDTEPTVAKPMGPRPRAVSKPIKDTSSTNTTSSTEEVETPSSTTSLRRKLSLGWRRSSSKAAKERVEETQEQQAQNRAQMPPPRLPASATWSGPIEGITQVQGTNSARPSLDTGSRKSSVASSMTTINGNDRAATTKPANTRSLHSEQTQPGPVSRSSSWSLLGARLAATKASSPMPRARTDSGPRLDKDDMAANDEMKRLSSKRREVDTAAKETDELRKRAVPQERMSPAQAIQTSAGLLNIYEKGEIIDFKDGVYFCGTKSAKKHVGDISAAGTTNFGYDDERGDYNIVMGDHLAYRYEVIDVLGKGSFGQVVRCIDHKHGGLCAVKIIRNKKRFHQQALVEVNILQKLKEWVSARCQILVFRDADFFRILMRLTRRSRSQLPFTSALTSALSHHA